MIAQVNLILSVFQDLFVNWKYVVFFLKKLHDETLWFRTF
jgi:hypothetical protein